MVKVDVLSFKARERKRAKVECNDCGQAFEFDLHELTALEEISAGEMADEQEEQYQGGFMIADGVVIDVPRRAWVMACRLFLMQDTMAYSVEEFIHIFFKFPNAAAKLADGLGSFDSAEPKKGGLKDRSSSQDASTKESAIPS